MTQPVFSDPRRARWKRLRTLLDVAGVVLSAIIVVFIYTALESEPLPKLFLQFQKRPYHALRENEHERAKQRRRQLFRRNRRRSQTPPSEVELNADEGIRAAFYVSWDAASFSSLREYARQIDLLYPEWLHVLSADGRLVSVDEQTNKPFSVVQNGGVRAVDDKVMAFLRTEDGGPEVFPLVNNFDGTNWIDISAFLNDALARARFRTETETFLASDKFHGLMVDFEDFPLARARSGFLALLTELAQDLHGKGMKLYVSVPAGNAEFPYTAVARASDGVVVMNYDEHYAGSGGTAGPVASQDWFTENLAKAKKLIPPAKLICAIANYGYDWAQAAKKQKITGVKDHVVSVQEAWLAARDSEEDVDFDGDSLNPHIRYLDDNNRRHDIWFLDGVTALNQMRAARQLGVRTFALWRLGSEDRSLWKVWDFPLDPAVPSRLADVPPGQDVDMEGD